MRYLILIFAVSLFSCGREVQPSSEHIEKYNEVIAEGYESNEGWVESPLFIALHLSGAGEVSSETRIRMRKLNKGETNTEVRITIMESGVLDDSDAESRSTYHMKLENNRWKVIQ